MEIKILDARLTLDMLRPQTIGSAGIDLYACIDEPIKLCSGESKLVSVGFAINIKDVNTMGIIVPRSGAGSKGLVIGNLVGVIDSDYQGPLKACVWNRNVDLFDRPMTIKPMDRIAQFMLMPVLHPEFEVVDEFSCETERGDKGFGSSGGSLVYHGKGKDEVAVEILSK